MHRNPASNDSGLTTTWSWSTAALTIVLTAPFLIFLSSITFTVQSMQGQTLQVIHNFSGMGDGNIPESGLTMDADGHFYGTTAYGGTNNCGVVFSLTHVASGWILKPIHSFTDSPDGCVPYGRVVIGPDGTLYGTTNGGGGARWGTVFHLWPPSNAGSSAVTAWNESVLYSFASGDDGASPEGDLTLDPAGSIYGTTTRGGSYGQGVVYLLTLSDGRWTETPICATVGVPRGGVIFDRAGHLYGVGNGGGQYGAGEIYRLSRSEPSWTKRTLYSFPGLPGTGYQPEGGLIMDSSGILYGTTAGGGTGGGGTVFELAPTVPGWYFNSLYDLVGPGAGPVEKLAMGPDGSLYGTTEDDGAYGKGSVFKLKPMNGGWTYTTLHDFTGGSDGGYPISGIVIDSAGNLYGTAYAGGTGQGCYAGACGVVWEITP